MVVTPVAMWLQRLLLPTASVPKQQFLAGRSLGGVGVHQKLIFMTVG
jgi:hypothetical protein